MRPGPSTDQLAGAVAVGVRLSSMRGGARITTSIPGWDVVLDSTDERTVPEQVTFTAPWEWIDSRGLTIEAVTSYYAPLNNFGQRILVQQLLNCDGQPSTVRLGWYQVDSWTETEDGDVQVTCLDLLTRPDQDPLAWPSSPPAGATLRSEMQRMSGLPVILDPGTVESPVPRNTSYGTSKTTNMRDLATSYNVGYGVKPDGYLHVWALDNSKVPVAHYSAVDLGAPGARPGRLLSAPRHSRARRPNRWTVVGSQSSGGADQQWSATVESTAPPYEPEAYGWVTDRREMNVAGSQRQVTLAAQTYQRTSTIVKEVRSLEIPADSRLERGDVISAYTDRREMLVGRIKAFSLPLSKHSDRERVDLEVFAA